MRSNTLLHRAYISIPDGSDFAKNVYADQALLQAVQAGAADAIYKYHMFDHESFTQIARNVGYLNADGSYSGKVEPVLEQYSVGTIFGRI